MKGLELRPVRNSLTILVLVAIAVCQTFPHSHGAVAGAKVFIGNQHTITSPDPPSDDWPTYHRDMLRSGYDPLIPGFTAVSIHWASTTLDGDVYAEPLIVGTDVVVATENNSLYELNATTGHIIWHINLGTPVNGAILPCGDINPSGITGTPVIDTVGRTIFAVAYHQAVNGTLYHELFAVNLDTGNVNFMFPIDPQGANVEYQQQRGALALANGFVYVPYGGLDGDCGPYHGWLTSMKTSGGGQQVSYQVPTGRAGAIWGGGDGPVVDSSGNLLVATGNSDATSTFDFGDSVIKLSPATSPPISVLDWFAPTNWATLNQNDLDLGSTEPVTLTSAYLFQIGKEGVGYELNAANLGHVGGQLYSAQVCSNGGGAYGGLAYASPYLVVPCDNGFVTLSVNPSSNPPFTVIWNGPSYLAGPPIIAGNAVWDVDVSDGLLYAFSLASGQTLFRYSIGSLPTHFNSVSAGDGQIFVSANRKVLAFQPTTAPFGQISTVASASADSELFFMPDFMAGVDSVVHNSASKCGGVGVALATDVYAATYFFGSLTNAQNEVLDTNSAYVSQLSSSCGQPTTSTSEPIVTVAGPLVNEVVHYYESTISPLYYNPSTECIVRRDTGVNVDCSTPTVTNDVFVLEAFTDAAGRSVFIIYGRAWPGTLAGFEYVVDFVLKNPTAYASSWYVYRWQDATSGASANSIPDPGDTYTQLASGP